MVSSSTVSSSTCNCCIHKNVCAFCEKYENTVQAVSKTMETIENDIESLKDFKMNVKVSCPHYVLPPNIR